MDAQRLSDAGGRLDVAGSSPILEHPLLVVTGMSVSLILWLAIMASVVPFTLYFGCYKMEMRPKLVHFLAPFSGVFSGWTLFGEGLPRCVGFWGIGNLYPASSGACRRWFGRNSFRNQHAASFGSVPERLALRIMMSLGPRQLIHFHRHQTTGPGSW